MSEKNKDENENQLSFDLDNIELSEINTNFDESVKNFNKKKNIFDKEIRVKEEEEGFNHFYSEDWELWSNILDKREEDVKKDWEDHLEKKVLPKLEKIIEEEINKIKITTDTEKTRGEIHKEAEALGSLAWNKMMSDQNLEAIEDYTKAISLSPNNRDNRSWFACRAEAFMKLGNYENALEDANRALEISLKNGSDLEKSLSYLSLGFYQEKLDKYEEALSSLNNSIRLYSENKESFLLRARINLSLNKNDKAFKDMDIYKNWYKSKMNSELEIMGKEDEVSKTIGEHPPGMYYIGDLIHLLMDCETYEGIESTYYSNNYLPESIVDEEIYSTKLSKNDIKKDYECMLRIRNCETEEITDICFKSKISMFKKLKDLWKSDNFEFSLITKEGYSKSKKPDKYRTEINKKSKVVNKDFYYYNFFEYEYTCVENTFAVWPLRGDGYYEDKNGSLSFAVDSGTIGCCRVEDSVAKRIKTRRYWCDSLYLAIHKGCVIELSASEREIFNPPSLDLLYKLGYFKDFEKSFKTKIIYSNKGEEKYFVIDDIYIKIKEGDVLDEE